MFIKFSEHLHVSIPIRQMRYNVKEKASCGGQVCQFCVTVKSMEKKNILKNSV
jgi:hypothetical protein